MSKGARGWAVINTHPHKERFAIENLLRQEFDAYCPMLRTTVRHARRTSVVLRPMFPGYIFAGIHADKQVWRPLLSTFGVRGVVRSGEKISLLPESFVAALQAREVDGAITRPSSPYKIGQEIRLVTGPFDGLVAKVIAMDERDRLVVLLDLLNRPVKVNVTANQVTEVG